MRNSNSVNHTSSIQPDECFICRKHRGLETAPPGGYILEDTHWLVCHAPVNKGPLGTLFIESRRHILDFADFDAEESRTFAPLLQRIYALLRVRLAVPRIYQLSMMEGIPHFHTWLLPRTPDIVERGVAFLAKDMSCTEAAARDLAAALRAALAPE